jgi:hypothetical protein
MNVSFSKKELDTLQKQYGVPVIEHQHVIAEAPSGVDHYMLVPELNLTHTPGSEGTTLRDMLQQGISDPSLIREIDRVAAGLAGYVRDVIREGGVITPDHMNLDQFAVDTSRKEGERVVYIDVEARNPEVVADPGKAGYNHDTAVVALVDLVEGLSLLTNTHPGAVPQAEARIREAFDALPANTPARVREIKGHAGRVLEGDRSALGQMFYTPSTRAVVDFPSRDAVTLFVATGKEIAGRELTPEEHVRVREYERTIEQARLRELGDIPQAPPRELPLHDEFGRSIDRGEKLGITVRELGEAAFGNISHPSESRDKEARGIDPLEQARSLAFSAPQAPDKQRVQEINPATHASQQLPKSMDARERGDELMTPQGKRQGRLGKFMDHVREYVPGVKTSREKENLRRIAEIAAVSAQARRAREENEQVLERGLREREVEPAQIDALRQQYGSLTAALNRANYDRQRAELERNRAERAQNPGSQQQKEREAPDAQDAALAAHVREVADEAKAQARSIADHIGRGQESRVKDDRVREIDILARMINPERFSERQVQGRILDETAHATHAQSHEPEQQGRERGDVPVPTLTPDLQKVKELIDLNTKSAEAARQRARDEREAERRRLEKQGKSPREIERELDLFDAARRADAPQTKRSGRTMDGRGREERTRER